MWVMLRSGQRHLLMHHSVRGISERLSYDGDSIVTGHYVDYISPLSYVDLEKRPSEHHLQSLLRQQNTPWILST